MNPSSFFSSFVGEGRVVERDEERMSGSCKNEAGDDIGDR